MEGKGPKALHFRLESVIIESEYNKKSHRRERCLKGGTEMTYLDDERLGLIQQILKERQKSSRAFVQYMNKPNQHLQEEQLHVREVHCISVIGPGEGKTMSQIAQELSVTHGAVSQIASRLEKKGYLLRQKAPSNRHQTIAKLTPLGVAFYEKQLSPDSEEYADSDLKHFSGFSLEELQQILGYEHSMASHFLEALAQKT